MKQALIIFVRNAELGKVKTRLAATMGDDAALKIYKKLLEHTLAITQQCHADKFVFYAGEIMKDDMWSAPEYFKLLQAETDLGNKMKTAFTQIFDKGYHKVCIIGSDCCQLTSALIEKAFLQLDNQDIVIGPANDGGYYLLAMKDELKEVFQNIEWSTEKALQQTIEIIEQKNYAYSLLETLNDVDTIEDVPQEWNDKFFRKGEY